MTGNYADARSYIVTGSETESQSWIGREVTTTAPFPVNEPQIAYFCALVEDPDENHWDAEAAGKRYGALISPPGMLMVWAFPLPWNPWGRPDHAPILALDVPLPGATLINVSTDTRFFVPMRVGDRLTFSERVESISTERRTTLGVGHFVTTRSECRNQDGTLVATNDNALFRYSIYDEEPPARQATRAPASPVEAIEVLPEARIPVTVTRCVLDAAATRDFFPGHHDQTYAREQGARNVYLNTMFFHGFVDRVAKAWAGPDAWLARRQLQMIAPVCAGDTLRTDGRVVSVDDGLQSRQATLAIDCYTEHGLAARSTLVFDLDQRQGPAARR
jgi:acyl dehydratase